MRLREGDVGNGGGCRAGNDLARRLPVANLSAAPPFNTRDIDVPTPGSLPQPSTRCGAPGAQAAGRGVGERPLRLRKPAAMPPHIGDALVVQFIDHLLALARRLRLSAHSGMH